MSLPGDQTVHQLPAPLASRPGELPTRSAHVEVTPSAPREDKITASSVAASRAADATPERAAAVMDGTPQLDGPGGGLEMTKMDADAAATAENTDGWKADEATSTTSGPAAELGALDPRRLLSPDRQQIYIDPTPATPHASRPPSRDPSAASGSRRSAASSDAPYASEDEPDEREGESRSEIEIQSIMEQFSESGGGPDPDEVMSPRLEMASPLLSGPIHHPPRQSSLEPLMAPALAGPLSHFNALHISTAPAGPSAIAGLSLQSGTPEFGHRQQQQQQHQQHQHLALDDRGPPVPPKDGAQGTPNKHSGKRASSIIASPTSPQLSMHRMPPPKPEPESPLPFDFHRFLEQLRNKKADPVARYLKSFLNEFGKRQWMVHEQVKIIADFLAFIANKMMVCEVWRDVSDAEFDNAREGMEKLVMNRLYTQTFSPAISPPRPIPGAKPKRKGGDPPMGPGRRGQHQEDVERDDIVTQKINIYGWVREEHLDIPPLGDSGRRFLKLAQQELLKIKSYRAPRDKIICVLNCCKVIFGLLKHNKADSSADSFMPLLIYVVLQSNPEHLVSNVQYILRFRNQDKLGGEAGYYLSSLMGAVQFIEHLDRTSLTVTDAEFEKNVEAAVSAIAEKHQHQTQAAATAAAAAAAATGRPSREKRSSDSDRSRHSLDGAAAAAAGPSTSSSASAAAAPSNDPGAPISGLLRTIQNPLSTIGRIFSDEGASSPASSPASSSTSYASRPTRGPYRDSLEDPPLHHDMSAEDAAARQVNAEVAEAQRIHRSEHANVVETLAGMFPDLDRDIISDVVYQKEGRVGLAVDACLALST